MQIKAKYSGLNEKEKTAVKKKRKEQKCNDMNKRKVTYIVLTEAQETSPKSKLFLCNCDS